MVRKTAQQKAQTGGIFNVQNPRTCGFTVVALVAVALGLVAYQSVPNLGGIPNSSEALTQFQQWVTHSDSVKALKVTPSVCEGMSSFCIRASDDIKAGDKLASYRTADLFSLHRSQDTKHMNVIVKFITSTQTPVDERVMMTLYLMIERFIIGPESMHFDYLNTLPSITGSSIYWDRSVLDMVKGTSLHSMTQNDVASIRKSYSFFFPQLTKKLPDMFPEDACSFRAFLWAYSIVVSRAVALPDGHHPYNPSFKNLGLLPLFDMVKPVTPGPGPFQTDYGTLKQVARRDPDYFHWIAAAAVPRGHAVEMELISGTGDDVTHLLHKFGMYQGDLYRAAFQADVGISRDPAQDTGAYKHATLVKKWGHLFSLTYSQDQVPAQFIAMIRNSFAPHETPMLALLKPLANKRLEATSLTTLQQSLSSALREVAGGYISEDEELLQGSTLSPNERVAVEYRLHIKKILSRHVQLLEEQVVALGPLPDTPTSSGDSLGASGVKRGSRDEDGDEDAGFDI